MGRRWTDDEIKTAEDEIMDAYGTTEQQKWEAYRRLWLEIREDEKQCSDGQD